MFRVPPSPFHMGKSSFQPVVANPIKLPSRRLSNTSNERTRPLSGDRPLPQDDVISESEPESYSNSYLSRDRPSHVVVKSAINGAAKGVQQHKGGKRGDNDYENSIVENSLQETDEESVIKDSFYEMQDNDKALNPTRTIIIPPPTTQKRKRHSLDESRKRKKLRNLDLQDLAKTPEKPTSRKKVSKNTSPQSQGFPMDKDLAVEPSIMLSKRERKEERRRRKKEKQERKMERRQTKEQYAVDPNLLNADEPKTETPDSAQPEMKIGGEPEVQSQAEEEVPLLGSQTERTTKEGKRNAIDSTLSDAEEPEFQIPDSTQQGRKTVQESDVQSQNEDDSSLRESQEPDTDKRGVVHQGKPSRKKSQGDKMDMPASQDQGEELDIQTTKTSLTRIQEDPIPPPSDLNVEKPSKTPTEIQKTQKRNAKAIISNLKQARRQAKSPHAPTPKRKVLSEAIIVDSSAEDDDFHSPEDDELKQIARTSKRRKVSDLEKLRTFNRKSPSVDADDSEEKETTKSGQRKPFLAKEDERLHRIVMQYKEREGLSDDEFLEELKSGEGVSGIKKDLELENWPGRKISILIRRIRRLYGVLNDRRTARKGPYSPEENAVVDSKVALFLKVRKMDKSEFPRFMAEDTKLNYSKRETRDMCEDIANHLEGRDILSVTRHVLKRYPIETFPGEWTAEDDATLRKLVAEKGKQWTVIAEQMGRNPDIVRLRYRDYASLGATRKAGAWTPEEARNLFETVVAMLENTEWTEDEGHDYEVVSKYIDWGAVSEKIGDRSRVQCKDKWRSLYKSQ